MLKLTPQVRDKKDVAQVAGGRQGLATLLVSVQNKNSTMFKKKKRQGRGLGTMQKNTYNPDSPV